MSNLPGSSDGAFDLAERPDYNAAAMQIVILLAFVLIMSLRQAPALALGAGVILPATVLYIALAAALAAISTARGVRVFAQANLPQPRKSRRVFWPLVVQLYLLVGLAALISLGLGPLVMHNRVIQAVPILGETLLLLPFVTAMVATWWMAYPLHRLVRQRLAWRLEGDPQPLAVWSLRQYIVFNFRHQFLFIAAPIGLIMLLHDLVLTRHWRAVVHGADAVAARLQAPPLGPAAEDVLAVAVALGLSLLVFLVAPAMIVRIWVTSALPAGELRELLTGTLRQLRLHCRALLVWHSGGVVANAGVMGLIAPIRYVLLSDALLARMDRRQVHAVFAHEAGHIQQHHIFYSALVTAAILIWVSVAVEWVARIWPMDVYLLQALMLVAMAAVWAPVFGYISRRFERQCDVIAAWAAAPPGRADDPLRVLPEGAAIFASALRRVAELNAMSTAAPNWRHGTIDWRVGYIIMLGSTGGTRRGIDSTVRRIKLAIWAAALSGLAAVLAMTFM